MLEKLPEPIPSVVLLFAIDGLGEVLQQTPRAVISAPPLSVILPPLVAETLVSDCTGKSVPGIPLMICPTF